MFDMLDVSVVIMVVHLSVDRIRCQIPEAPLVIGDSGYVAAGCGGCRILRTPWSDGANLGDIEEIVESFHHLAPKR